MNIPPPSERIAQIPNIPITAIEELWGATHSKKVIKKRQKVLVTFGIVTFYFQLCLSTNAHNFKKKPPNLNLQQHIQNLLGEAKPGETIYIPISPSQVNLEDPKLRDSIPTLKIQLID